MLGAQGAPGGGGGSGQRCEGQAVRHDQSPAKSLPKERKGKIKKLIFGSHRNVHFIQREVMNTFIRTPPKIKSSQINLVPAEQGRWCLGLFPRTLF